MKYEDKLSNPYSFVRADLIKCGTFIMNDFLFIGIIFWILGRYIIDMGIIAPAPNITLVTKQIPGFWEFFSKYWPPQILNYLSSFKWVYFFPLFLITKLLKKSSNSFMKIYGFNFKGYFGIHTLVFIFYSF